MMGKDPTAKKEPRTAKPPLRESMRRIVKDIQCLFGSE